MEQYFICCHSALFGVKLEVFEEFSIECHGSFLNFKELIRDLQSHSASNRCHLIMEAFGIFLFTGLAKRWAMSQHCNSEAVAPLQVQPPAPSQLFQCTVRQLLRPQGNKAQQNRRDACATADFGDRSPSYYLSCPSQGCPGMLWVDIQLSSEGSGC